MKSQEYDFAWTMEMEGGRQLSCPIWQFVRCIHGIMSLDSSIVVIQQAAAKTPIYVSLFSDLGLLARDPRDLTLTVEDQIPMANRLWIVIGWWPLSMLRLAHTPYNRFPGQTLKN